MRSKKTIKVLAKLNEGIYSRLLRSNTVRWSFTGLGTGSPTKVKDKYLFFLFFFTVGPPKEDIFSGHLLSPLCNHGISRIVLTLQ